MRPRRLIALYLLVLILFVSYTYYKAFVLIPLKNEPTINTDLENLTHLLDDLDRVIYNTTNENRVYGNIYSGKSTDQLKGYISTVKQFAKSTTIRRICEIGFAGGHSATLFLRFTQYASYIGFDMWDQPVYEDKALQWLKKTFIKRNIHIIKGYSAKTVSQFQGQCDIIHIDGAHHANFPQTDMVNMARVAAKNNLLLIDDCTKSWPSVLKGVEHLKMNNLVYDLKQYVATGWVHRGAQKGWCIGHYDKTLEYITIILMGNSPKRLPNYDIILQTYAKMECIDQIIIVWNNKDVAFNTKSNATVTLIQNENNSMNNRFNVSNFVRTKAVLIIDDDVVISEPLLSIMLSNWSLNTDRSVGVDRRFVNRNSEYEFKGKTPSLILGKTMLFHRKYLVKYMEDKTLVEWNSHKFCEDISMNGLIFKTTRKLPLFVQMTSKYRRGDLPEIDGASLKVKSEIWIANRTECVQWVSNHFQINFYKGI